MPTAVTVDRHAIRIRIREQDAAVSVCGAASRMNVALGANHPVSEKNEQYQFFMSDLSQNEPRSVIPSKEHVAVTCLKGRQHKWVRKKVSFSSCLCRLANFDAIRTAGMIRAVRLTG
jgi:hypothetical protein